MITTTETEWAKIVHEEILNSSENWWRPVDSNHQIFEQALMKFINRNLNYYNYENMVLSLLEGYQYNKELPKTLEFCEFARLLTLDKGPFGRMCVWHLPPGAELLPHVDNFKYHNMIIRNIFIVSDHNNSNSFIKIQGKDVEYGQGTLFQFRPAREEHSFKNNSDRIMYFLGFDYWIPELLFLSLKHENLLDTFRNETRQNSDKIFGVGDCKFMSNN